jgi:hypothetical protein
VYNGVVDTERERLRDLSRELFRLHGLLLDRERRTYEHMHGPVAGHALLQLLLHHDHFAWLRALSGLMALVDEAVDSDEPVPAADAERLLRETHRLLKSGDEGVFHTKYRDALQESPDVVMVHAGITEVLRR